MRCELLPIFISIIVIVLYIFEIITVGRYYILKFYSKTVRGGGVTKYCHKKVGQLGGELLLDGAPCLKPHDSTIQF